MMTRSSLSLSSPLGTLGEWRTLLVPQLHHQHRWPLSLVNIVIDYLYDTQRLVIIGHDLTHDATVIWSLSYSTIRHLCAPSSSSTYSGSSSSSYMYDDMNQWGNHVTMPTKVKDQWYLIDPYHQRIIHGMVIMIHRHARMHRLSHCDLPTLRGCSLVIACNHK
jgi:hypothetical protein